MNIPDLRIEVHERIAQLDATAWEQLTQQESPFLEHGFLLAMEQTECFGQDAGWFPMFFVATRKDAPSTYIGALPFFIKTNSQGEFVFDWGWADAAYRAGIRYYPKGLVAAPFTPATGRRVLLDARLPKKERLAVAESLIQAALAFAQRSGLSSVHFNFILKEELSLFEQADLPIRYGMQYHWKNRSPLGQPYHDFDEFLGRFRAKRRANIRRERRALADTGVTTCVLQRQAITEAVMAKMYAYYVDTVRKFYYGHQYLTQDFFLKLPEVARDRLHVVFARDASGRDFAGAFNMLKNKRLYGRYWGCSEEVPFAHFEVCMYSPISWCIEHGVEVFEPGAGGEHKYERGFEPTTPTAHIIWWRSHLMPPCATS